MGSNFALSILSMYSRSELAQIRINGSRTDLLHPVNQFKLMKRFEIDWPKIENALAHRNILDQRLGEVLERVKNGKAYETAQDGILRIQRTYNIEPKDSVSKYNVSPLYF